MRWEGHQESSNVEDRRRLGKKGLAIGGGGAILVLLIGALFGVDPQRLNQLLVNAPVGADRQVQERPPTKEEERTRRFAATILRFTEEVWDEQFRRAGQ
jgi:uncharacterized protein